MAYLKRMSKMGMTLEIELGCTGGEEDGVDNTHMDNSALYTQPKDVAYAYEELMKVSLILRLRLHLVMFMACINQGMFI